MLGGRYICSKSAARSRLEVVVRFRPGRKVGYRTAIRARPRRFAKMGCRGHVGVKPSPLRQGALLILSNSTGALQEYAGRSFSRNL